MNDVFARMAAFIARRRWQVLIIWLILLVVAGVLAPLASSRVRGGGFTVPGSDSYTAAAILAQDFNASTGSNVVALFRSTHLTAYQDPFRNTVTAAVARLRKVPNVQHVFSFYDTGSPALVSNDGHATIALISLGGDEGKVEDTVPSLRAQLTSVTVEHYLTGFPAINKDGLKTSDSDLQRAELVTFPVVLLLLLIVFRTVVAAVLPLVVGVASVLLSTAALAILAGSFDVSVFALNVASLIGLGLSIDYSLLVVTRYREERARSSTVEEAVVRTMATAGRSISYSGLTVALAMLIVSLVLSNLMIIRSISIGVLLVVIMAVLASLTLLPAVLAILGDRIERLTIIRARPARPVQETAWYRLSYRVMGRPWRWLLGSLIVLVALAYPLHDIRLVGATTNVLPSSVESVKGSQLMTQEFGANQLTPIQIVLRTHKNGIWDSKFLDALARTTTVLQNDPRALNVQSLSTLLAPVPYDQYLTVHSTYFAKADPSLIEAATHPGTLPHPAGTQFQTIIDFKVNSLPRAPAYVGIGRFTMKPGSHVGPLTTSDLHLLRVESGSVTVQVQGGRAEMTRGWMPNMNMPNPVQRAPSGPFSLNPGDQLLIPGNTVTTLSNTGNQPAVFLGMAILILRSDQSGKTTWGMNADLFDGIPRVVLAGSVARQLPTGPTMIESDRAVLAPGAFLPKHIHPGPELIFVVKGVFTVFQSNLMTVSDSKGRVLEDVPFDTPMRLHPGSRALVQMYGVHRGGNLTKGTTIIYSTRIEDASQPMFYLIGPRQGAAQFINLDGNADTAVISVVAKTGQYDPEHEGFVNDLRNRIIPEIPGLSAYHVYVGGDAAAFIDFQDQLYGRFPIIIALILVLIFVILLMFFQSVWLPIKAMILSLLSILATLGVLVIIFQHGVGAGLLGFKSQGMVNVITPAILYVVLFALSTDYEVFLLSRVKEAFEESGDNQESVAIGLSRTGSVITAAGLILIGTFGSFATAEIVTLKEIGLGLAIGVLIDSTLVRIIMVPATMKLLGNWNWWMPAGWRRFVPELREAPRPARSPEPGPAVAASRANVTLLPGEGER